MFCPDADHTQSAWHADPSLQLRDALDQGVAAGFRRQLGLREAGGISKLLTIDAKGDVVAAGALKGRLTTGAVQVQSGIATHGTVLPLPPGISQAQVDDGSATLYTLVSPLVDPRHAPDPSLDWAGLVQECRVDGDRRVHCRICWFDLDFSGGNAHGQQLTSQPGVCEYLVLGTTTSGEGS